MARPTTRTHHGHAGRHGSRGSSSATPSHRHQLPSVREQQKKWDDHLDDTARARELYKPLARTVGVIMMALLAVAWLVAQLCDLNVPLPAIGIGVVISLAVPYAVYQIKIYQAGDYYRWDNHITN